MKRLFITAVMVGAFALLPAAAQAEIYVSPAAEAEMKRMRYSVVESAFPSYPAQDKYCPGIRRHGQQGVRLRNWKGGTLVHHGVAATFCYNADGHLVWHRVTDVWVGAPSRYFNRTAGALQTWEKGTLWSNVWWKEHTYGDWSDTILWRTEIYVNYRPGCKCLSKGARIYKSGSRYDSR